MRSEIGEVSRENRVINKAVLLLILRSKVKRRL